MDLAAEEGQHSVAFPTLDAGPEPSRYIIILPARLDELISLVAAAPS